MKLDGINNGMLDGLAINEITNSSFLREAIKEEFSLPRAAFWGIGSELAYDVSKWAGENFLRPELPNGGFSEDFVPVTSGLLSPEEGFVRSFPGSAEGISNQSRLTPVYCKDVIKQMYQGTEANGIKTLSLDKISKWKINKDFKTQNLKQHAGYSAEVISTAKENIQARRDGTGTTTVRADDLPKKYEYKKNDQFVDKVRLNEAGEVIERIQSKFVGNNGESCLKKLASKKMDKYFKDGKVDTIEIPKDFYKEIKENNLIGKKIEDLEKQLSRVTEDGKLDVAKKIEDKIAKYKQIDEMVKPSSVTSHEATYATKHPKRYAAKITAGEAIKNGNAEGLKSGAAAAGITFCMSSVDNIRKVMTNEATPKEAFENVAKETGTAGAIGYSTAFVSRAVETVMSESSHELLNTLGASGVPAAVVSFAVESYDSITDFATGTIDAKELTIDLGENAVGVAGSMLGSAAAGAAAGAALGSIVPGAGTVVGAGVGFAASMAGGMVGYALTTEAYKTAVEFGSKTADGLLDKAKGLAKETIEAADQQSAKAGNAIRDAIGKFNIVNKIPISLGA